MINATAFELKKITARKKFTLGALFEAAVITLIMIALNFANSKIRENVNVFLTLPDFYPLVLKAYTNVVLRLRRI